MPIPLIYDRETPDPVRSGYETVEYSAWYTVVDEKYCVPCPKSTQKVLLVEHLEWSRTFVVILIS